MQFADIAKCIRESIHSHVAERFLLNGIGLLKKIGINIVQFERAAFEPLDNVTSSTDFDAALLAIREIKFNR